MLKDLKVTPADRVANRVNFCTSKIANKLISQLIALFSGDLCDEGELLRRTI